VKNAIIWGNHSSTQPSDANYTTVTANSTVKLVRELVPDDHW
jgi:malate dehydrogenase